VVEANPVGATVAAPRLRLLDLARLCAALSVVLFHYTGRPSPVWDPGSVFPLLSRVTEYGALGVYLFFMISGFVVLMSAWGRTVGQFAASRISRLYPAYWFAVLTTGALLFADRSGFLGTAWSGLGPTGVLANLTMLQPALGIPHVDGVYWTLWVELRFYLLLGLLMLLGLTRNRVLAFAALWPLVGAFARMAHEQLLTEVLLPDYAPFFAIGMLLFLTYREGPSLVPVVALALNLVLAITLTGTSIVPFYAAVAGVNLSPTVSGLLIVVMAALMVALTQTPLARVGWRWLTVAGALTYPLYLLHEIWGWEALRVLTPTVPPYLAVLLVVLAALVVAYLVYRLIERPFGPRMRKSLDKAFAGMVRRNST
jgi:peptidoglycan/LPS O-acetylase OafA/YrhL